MSDITMGGAPGEAPGGPDSNESAGVAGSTDGEVLMYATLPLQIGASAGAQGLQRIDWKQFATSPQLVLCLQDMNGVPINLTGVQAVTLHLSPALGGGTLLSEAMTPLYANGGLVGYHFQASDVALSGTFNMEVEVLMADGSGMYFPSTGYLPFVINPSLG